MPFDQPGKLYLGREYDLGAQQPTDTPVTLNARNLTTHAVCLGMTGTGKTGLGIVTLEEALVQGVPCIIVDPKGDIVNLALTFPNLGPNDFKRWLDEDEAHQQGMTLDQWAQITAQKWREGLAHWSIGPERMAALHDRVQFDIYTPGSDAGIQVNVLQSLSPPTESNLTWVRSSETLRERIAQIVQAILGLAGIEADPMQSREHILLATIFEASWRAGQTLDINALIQQIQSPPVLRVGAFDMDVFYPRDDRFKLAMALNNLIASPSFAAWTNGVSLDIATLLKPDRSAGGPNPLGKTRASIFYLAHLGEAERQFFVTLLLSQLVLWMRGQTGTSSLRALVYFDEVFGYAPPFPRNPPTKTPLLTLIKQGRAAGLGMFLATQNPADLDYKGLANIGTWFIGRLRTGRDRDRALEGLEGAGGGFDRAHFEAPLGNLPPRVFLLQGATGDPHFFETRWAMSFLCGPLSRDQVSTLMPKDDRTSPVPALEATGLSHGPASTATDATPAHPATATSATATTKTSTGGRSPSLSVQSPTVTLPTALRPQLPPDVREVYIPIPPGGSAAHTSPGTPHAPVTYRPFLLASATVRITDRTSGVNQDERYTYLVPFNHVSTLPDFAQVQPVKHIDPAALTDTPAADAMFAPLPAGINARWMRQVERLLVEHVYRHGVTKLPFNKTLKVYGQPDESPSEFRERCEGVARDKRNAEAAKMRVQFERRMQALQDHIAREHRELVQDRTELSGRKREELLGGVESVFNFITGHRQNYAVAFGARRRREVEASQQAMQVAEEALSKLSADLRAVAEEYKAALSHVSDKWMRALNDVTDVPLAPKKGDIFADLIALAWVPTGASG